MSDVPDARLRLEWAVRALAQPAEIQRALFPDFVRVADELVLDLDDAVRDLSPARELASLSPAASEYLLSLDRALAELSAPEHAGLWTDAALRDDVHWARIRRYAGALVRAMGWPEEPPPRDRAACARG